MAKFNEKRNKEEKESAEKEEAQEALENLKKYFKRLPADFDWKKEYLEWVDEKYGVAD